MNAVELKIEKADMKKLLSAASGDAALLYLYLKGDNDPAKAAESLNLTEQRFSCAAATLRQLGLWQEDKRTYIPGQRPNYTEQDVVDALGKDSEFHSLYGEVQRLLGKNLNTEELKILLGFVRYLGMSADVVYVLVCYCKDRARQKGRLRNPSLSAIEKEAYAWAEQGIDTMEEAAAFIQTQNQRNSQLGEMMRRLQIRGRDLTAGEEKYARQWLEAGFDMELIDLAYERTCLNTGSLNWAYMNKILTGWKEAGLLTVEQAKNSNTKKLPKGASGKLGAAELESIQQLLREE